MYENHIRFRRFDASRIKIIDGGFRAEQTTELWIVPEGATSPKPKDSISPPKTPKNKTYLYDHVYMDATYFFLPSEDEESWKAEIADETSEWIFNWVNADFAKKIKEQKNSRGVIVYYADDEYHDMNKITAHLAEAKRRLAKEGKIAFERIDILFGGFRGSIEFEVWIVPKNGEEPRLTPRRKRN